MQNNLFNSSHRIAIVIICWAAITKYHNIRVANTTEMYALSALEATNPTSRYWQGLFLPRAVKICSVPLTQLLVGCRQSLAFLGLYNHHPDLHLHLMFSLCRSMFKFPLLIRPSITLD